MGGKHTHTDLIHNMLVHVVLGDELASQYSVSMVTGQDEAIQVILQEFIGGNSITEAFFPHSHSTQHKITL